MTKKIEKRRFFYNVPKDSPIARWCESQDSFTKSLNWLIKSVIHLTGNDHIDIFDYISQQDNLVNFLSQSSNSSAKNVNDKISSNDNVSNENQDDLDPSDHDPSNKKENRRKKESKKKNKVNTNNFKEIPGLFNGADDFN